MKNIFITASLLLCAISYGQDTLSTKDMVLDKRTYFTESGEAFTGCVKDVSGTSYSIGNMINGQYNGYVKTYKDGKFCCQVLYLTSDTTVTFEADNKTLYEIAVYGSDKRSEKWIKFEDGKVSFVSWKLGWDHDEMTYNYTRGKNFESSYFQMRDKHTLDLDKVHREVSLMKGRKYLNALRLDEDCPIQFGSTCYDSAEDIDEDELVFFTPKQDGDWLDFSTGDVPGSDNGMTWGINHKEEKLRMKVDGFSVLYDGKFSFPAVDALQKHIEKRVAEYSSL